MLDPPLQPAVIDIANVEPRPTLVKIVRVLSDVHWVDSEFVTPYLAQPENDRCPTFIANIECNLATEGVSNAWLPELKTDILPRLYENDSDSDWTEEESVKIATAVALKPEGRKHLTVLPETQIVAADVVLPILTVPEFVPTEFESVTMYGVYLEKDPTLRLRELENVAPLPTVGDTKETSSKVRT